MSLDKAESEIYAKVSGKVMLHNFGTVLPQARTSMNESC